MKKADQSKLQYQEASVTTQSMIAWPMTSSMVKRSTLRRARWASSRSNWRLWFNLLPRIRGISVLQSRTLPRNSVSTSPVLKTSSRYSVWKFSRWALPKKMWTPFLCQLRLLGMHVWPIARHRLGNAPQTEIFPWITLRPLTKFKAQRYLSR